MNTKLILIGGFLGAGKTTFLWLAAKKFAAKGEKVGLITNDQASALVDTSFLSRSQGEVIEVSGSCFCCNYPGFAAAVESLKSQGATVIIAEPVGSCTDLSATIMQPLKDTAPDLTIYPLTVLVDPAKLADLLAGGNAGLHESAAYIVKKQLEEADLIVIHKADTLNHQEQVSLIENAEKEFPGRPILAASAKTGSGLDIWMDVAGNEKLAGQRIVEVDYDVYAEGEAVLGWLNLSGDILGELESLSDLTYALLDALGSRFAAAAMPIGHVKVMLEQGDEYVLGNIAGELSTTSVRGNSETRPISSNCKCGSICPIKLTVNARVETAPETLEKLVTETIAAVIPAAASYTVAELNCLSPGRPDPTHRYTEVI